MDIQGKVKTILPEQKFQGKKGEFVRYGFIIETSGAYPKNVKFDVLGVDRWAKLAPSIVVGNDVQVYFDVESRQWKESWFTSVSAYRVNVVGTQDTQTQVATQTPATKQEPQQTTSESELPF